jgi:hypothetical protein
MGLGNFELSQRGVIDAYYSSSRTTDTGTGNGILKEVEK